MTVISKKVRGTQVNSPNQTEVNVDTVYVRSNIIRIETADFSGWEYDEEQYEKNDYISIIASGQNTLENNAKTDNQKYKELDLTTATLIDVQTAKMNQLNELCNLAIVNGFDYTVNATSYHFSCSLSAQANFQGTDTLFKDGLITNAQWTATNNTTEKDERIMLDQPTFNSIKLAVFQNINSNVTKFRNTLQPEVEAATTNDDVDKINW